MNISAHRLHNSKILYRDTLYEGASLFPFFNGDGEVLSLMFVYEGCSKIYFFKPQPGALKIPLLGTLKLGHSVHLRPAAQPLDLPELVGAWHYDPWWLLAHERFSALSVVPFLKATNCVKPLPKLQKLYFSADLLQVQSLFLRGEEEVLPWRAGLLGHSPARIEEREEPWILDPSWES